MKTMDEILCKTNKQDTNVWVIDNLIRNNSINMLSGETSCGKTMIGIDMATSILDSKNFLGRTTTKQKVLYISTEADYESISQRFVDCNLENYSDLKIDCEYDTNDFNIRDKVRESDFIIVDILADFFKSYTQDNNDYWDVYEVFNSIRKDCVLNKKTWLFIHHLNKKGIPMGSQAFDAAPDTRMNLTAPDGRTSYLRLLEVYGKRVPLQEIKINFSYPNVNLMTEDEDTEQLRVDKELAEIIEVATSRKEICCSASELCRMLKLSRYGLTHNTITKYLNANKHILEENLIDYEIGHNHEGRYLKLAYRGKVENPLQCDSDTATLIEEEQ